MKDVKEIASMIETEVFVQGALCTCFSGQCYMSALAGGNSGNRGACKQPVPAKSTKSTERGSIPTPMRSLFPICARRKI